MASKRTSLRVRRDHHGLSSVLASAVLEWLLMFLLFLDALFSYLVTKFASFFELETPCLLCSRLDHIIGGEKPGFYRDLICRAHKLEISSFAYCHAHEKLANTHGMCEGCLFSFATEKKSNSEAYRSLVGKLGPDLECFAGDDGNMHLTMPEIGDGDGLPIRLDGEDLVKDPLLKDPLLGSAGTRHCSCCDVPLRSNRCTNLLVRIKSIGDEVAELDGPISGAMGHHSSIHRDGLKRRREKSSGSAMVSDLGNHSFDPWSRIGYTEVKITSDSESEVHIGYTEVKITSDSESEVLILDDDDGSELGCENHDLKDEFLARCLKPESGSVDADILPETLSTDSAQEKLIHQAPVPEPSVPVPHEQLHVVEPSLPVPHEQLHVVGPHEASAVVGSIDSDVLLKNLTTSLTQEELIHQSQVPEPSLPFPHEQLHVGEPHEVSSLAPVVDARHGLEELNWDPVDDQSNPPATSRELPSSATLTEAPVGVSEDKLDVTEAGDVVHASITESAEIVKLEGGLASIESQLKTEQTINELGLLMPNCMDLNDAYKLAVGNKGSLPSGAFTEIPTRKDSSRVHEDFKILLSQISAARGFDLLWSDMSPRVHVHGDDSKSSDASSSIGLQILQKRLSRNESGFESLDGSIVSEIEGESAVDRMKRQIELDRKSMSALYKELEEERNASAIAVNQAMAMINKLQEEKATMQMEALQYQRMMEEQAEYDQEAIQTLNELLIQREKEIHDLEEEFENYRRRFENEPVGEKILGLANDLSGGDIITESSYLHSNVNCDENNTHFPVRRSDGDGKLGVLKDSLLDFEDEKLYISKCLKMLEKKLHLFSNNGIYTDKCKLDANGDGIADTKCEDFIFREFTEERGFQDDVAGNGGFVREDALGGSDGEQIHLNEREDFSAQNDSSLFGGGAHAKVRWDTQLITKENCSENLLRANFDHDRPQSSVASGGTDLVSLGDEVSHLKERLETLEADRSFLEHTMNSLGHGNEGVQFVREIAIHLRDLRKIGIGRREQAVA
ncbi:myosin-binding protein 1-like [Magnolia sinica]|uniref:myosin-binding protein 1-like n=1 Tax=Magnolia sinica TaxID=86752 RepID=UPI002658CE1C|nr:myosin-binding protein 1-like [Magnolia sinica]XP_058087013.1 myosin-binding protein 1-like [Magnolia sinica]XP_058087014.1 myosin-binding protein 1-like [Magnolia sinica]